MAVVTTVETVQRMVRGRLQPVTITRHEGLATYTDNGRTFEAELATIIDYGKDGVTRCYTPPRAQVSDEERARNRENIYRTVASVLRDMGIQ